MNIYVTSALAALIPLAIGFIWYNPKVLGNAWMKSAGLTEESMKGANMAVIFGVSLLLSMMLAMSMQMLVIHQTSLYSLFFGQPIDDPNSEVGIFFKSILDRVGTSFRTFKHGVLHGVLSALFIILPVLGTNALFERKGFKYIAINVGYWAITMGIMGGIICAFA